MTDRSVLAAQRILRVVEAVEARCMAADGPVTPTLREMTEAELRTLWRAARAIASAAPKRRRSSR